jgi:hypothetical protein
MNRNILLMNERRNPHVFVRMKSCLFLVLALLLVLGSLDANAQFRRNYHADMAVDADVQEDFYKRYPDLRDESDVVATTARKLATERPSTQSDAEAAEMLAARVRTILAMRPELEWQKKAMALYPDLSVAGSDFNTLFLRHVRELEKTSPQFMQEPSWPVLLARRVADELRPKSAATSIAGTATGPAATSGAATATVKPASPARWWMIWPSVIVLVILLALPARFLMRCSRAFAGTEGSNILWQRALLPTSGAYLVVALAAMWRTFTANADMGIVDRFGVTLLVSLLTGVVFAVLAYAITLGGMWWWRHREAASLRTAGAGERKA